MSNLEIGGDTLTLTCPKCGNDNMHQETVEVVMRDKFEDCDATRTICARGPPSVTRVKDEDIEETRRDFIRIAFSCEDCSQGT